MYEYVGWAPKSFQLKQKICFIFFLKTDECMRVQFAQSPEEGIKAAGDGVPESCALPNLSVGNQTLVLCKSSTSF